MCCHLLLYGIFLTLGWKCLLCLLHCRQSLLSHNLRSHNYNVQIQLSSVAQACWTLCHPMDFSTPGFPVHHQLPKLAQTMSNESVMPSNHLMLCHPLSSCLQSFPASGSFPMSQFLASDDQNIKVSASASNEYLGLIFFRID